MSFDIQQPVFDPDGEYLEDAAIRYREELMERFEASPEGQDLVSRGGTIGWAEGVVKLARQTTTGSTRRPVCQHNILWSGGST